MLSIIIVNYNAGNYLRECIQTLPVDSNIIIVDNASHDDSLIGITNLYPYVKIIRNSQNLGFAAACNIGAKASQTDLLLFLNPDCHLLPDTLSELITALESAPDIGMVGGLLLNPDGTEQAGGRRSVPTPWRSLSRVFGLSKLFPQYFKDFNLHTQSLPTTPLAVEAISGACMLMKKSTFEQLGAWDEQYFLHCEDLDLCMRYRCAGYRILFVPSAPLIHYKGVCSQSRPLTVEWHKHKGMLRFYQKFFRHQYPGPLIWLVSFSVALRLASIAGYYSLKNSKLYFMSTILISGASSIIGSYLLQQLQQQTLILLSRSNPSLLPLPHQQWLTYNLQDTCSKLPSVDYLIHLAPIWLLPTLLNQLQPPYPTHIIAISSTSRLTKLQSNSVYEKKIVQKLIHGEEYLQEFAKNHQLNWTILRPTLIYAKTVDKNISVIASLIKRFKCFPLVADGKGLRQPIHAEDIAIACNNILNNPSCYSKSYNIGGGEIITYRDMVTKVFQKIKQKPIFIPVPTLLLKSTLSFLKPIPRFKNLTPNMIDRMKEDLIFNITEAQQDFNFKPRTFQPLT